MEFASSRLLRAVNILTHLIVSKSAMITLKEETALSVDALRSLATAYYQNTDIGAAVSSGSFKTRGMIIVPCSDQNVIRNRVRDDR